MTDIKYEYTTIRTCPVKAILLNSSRNSHLNIKQIHKFLSFHQSGRIIPSGTNIGANNWFVSFIYYRKVEK